MTMKVEGQHTTPRNQTVPMKDLLPGMMGKVVSTGEIVYPVTHQCYRIFLILGDNISTNSYQHNNPLLVEVLPSDHVVTVQFSSKS